MAKYYPIHLIWRQLGENIHFSCTLSRPYLEKNKPSFSFPDDKIPLKDLLLRQQLKRNDHGELHIFINNFHVHEMPPSPCNPDIKTLTGLICTVHNYGFCGFFSPGFTNEWAFSFVPNDFGLYKEILNCPQSNRFAKMLLEHLYKFSNKRGFH